MLTFLYVLAGCFALLLMAMGAVFLIGLSLKA